MAICFTERPQDVNYRCETFSTVRAGDRDITCRTLCSDTLLYAPDGSEMGVIFSVACMAEGENRPLMVIFNGGPGGNSTWLQLGFLGTRLSQTDADGMPVKRGPYALRDNPDCLLDLCDLLFYNPPGAGYSRLFDEQYAPLVFGDHGDADAAEQFIRRWLADNGRESAPLYILGESFGSTRASLLAKRLSDLDLRAVLHVGPGYTGDSWTSRTLKDLVPCAATRWYFDERPDKGTLEETVAEARDFLMNEYLGALHMGTMLPEERKRYIAGRLAQLTGLSEAYYMENGLQVVRAEFREKLLADQGLRVGSFDTRFTLPLTEQADPTLAAFEPSIAACAAMYFAEVMPQLPQREFRDNSFDETDAFPWPFDAEADMMGYGGNWYAMKQTVGDCVHEAWLKKPQLRLFFATGYFDTVATVENTRYAITHTRIPFENVTLKEYASGHAVYADDASRHQLALDIRAFLQEGCS
ncbi:MAG: hypothetical protein ACI4O7_00370 [Aristaeellaceae bacterium]